MTTRTFRPLNQQEILHQTFCLEDLLPAEHPARRLVALMATWELTALYQQYAAYGPPAYDPRQLLALLLYGYMNGLFGSRQLERATYEVIPCLYIMGGAHPDHSTLAAFRTLVFQDGGELFTQVLRAAQQHGQLTLGAVSGDGTKIHAHASKHAAVSYEHAQTSLANLRKEMNELRALALQANPSALPAEMDLAAELQVRLERIDRLETAIQIIEERAQARFQQEQAAYDAKVAAREERARITGKPPRGKPPVPPTPGPRPKDQYNFTDADSRIMKNSTNTGVDQHYNAQVAVDQQNRFIVGCDVSDQPNDMQQAVPLLQTIPAILGIPFAAAFDAGFRSASNVLALEAMGITPYFAASKQEHGLNWRQWFTKHPDRVPSPEAGPLERMDYAVMTEEGQRIYRQRKSTVEPVIGIVKDVIGFRQFLVRGLDNVRAEWRLVCTAYNLKRLMRLLASVSAQQAVSQGKSAVMHAVVNAFTVPYRLFRAAHQQCQRRVSITMSRYTAQAALVEINRSRRPWPTGC